MNEICFHDMEQYGNTKICKKCGYIYDATEVPKYNAPQDTSDGYHTFEELYEHRMALFSVICNTYKENAWKSWLHDDGTMFDDYFIVGVTTSKGDYSYHYHKDFWDNFDVKELERAPKWDGHKPEDYDRLYTLVEDNQMLHEIVETGDLVTLKGKHEAKVHYVEAVDEDGVLLVDGVKDLFYSKEDGNLEEFNSKFRLLAKSESLLRD